MVAAKDSDGRDALVRKRTKVITNSSAIDGKLNRQCTKDHEHAWLTGKKPKAALDLVDPP